MTTWLLDGNVLVALRLSSHIHHDRVNRWFATLTGHDRFVTCAITQGTLLRVHMRCARDQSAAAAWQALDEISSHRAHSCWKLTLSYLEVEHRNLQGSAQVTDAYLAQLARSKKGRLATMDSALAELHSDVATLLPL